jgi:hypothetical protein
MSKSLIGGYRITNARTLITAKSRGRNGAHLHPARALSKTGDIHTSKVALRRTTHIVRPPGRAVLPRAPDLIALSDAVGLVAADYELCAERSK